MENLLITRHLRNMVILGTPVRALQAGAFYPDCRLRRRDDGESFALFGASWDPKPGRIALTYTIDGYLHGFETDVLGIDDFNGPGALLRIDLPRKIVRIERRRFCRVEEDQPLNVTALLGSERIEVRAIAVSEEHIGLVLPIPHPHIIVDAVLSLSISLPGQGEISAKGVVHFLRESYGAQGLVAALEEMPEADHAVLAGYVRSREVELRTRHGTQRRESSFLVTTHFGQESHVFWCPAVFMGTLRATNMALDVVSVEAVDYLGET